MLEDLKKKGFKKSLPTSIILIIAGLVLAVYNAVSAFYALAGYAAFEDLRPERMGGQLVETDLNIVYGCYLQQGTKNTSTNRTTYNYYWYLIATGDVYETDYRFMAIKVPKSLRNEVDDIVNYYNTYGIPAPDSLKVTGKVKRFFPDKYYDHFHELFVDDMEWSEEDFKELAIPYYIDVNLSLDTVKYGYVLLFAGGVALILWGIVRIVKGAKGSFLKRFIFDYQNAGYTDSAVESDMASASCYTKHSDIRIGRLCTYYGLNTSMPRAIPNSKIMWAYQNTTTHRTNGVKTGTTYSVMVYADGFKNSVSIGVPDEPTAQDILKKMGEIFPWVIVGYSDELRKMYNKDRAQFLQLRYNTVEHVAVEPGFETSGYETPGV
ncbi:MAG: hypothetical protein NC389_13730 [Acetatifactor muris]|nr:hypothetical protein [Acetatifactor muris]